jgi:dTDP-4-dehydrorhamnose 3,5-epimerase
LLLQPAIHGDARGFLVESYRESTLREFGVEERFVQDNHSRSRYGVIRGMHFQLDPPAAKLVRCGRGAIFDVLVDVRPDSPTYGQWDGHELSDENGLVLYVPAGFAHGFCVISEVADVLYKQTAYWAPETDRGVALDDPELAIDWPVPREDWIISDRDARAPRLADVAGQLAPTGREQR